MAYINGNEILFSSQVNTGEGGGSCDCETVPDYVKAEAAEVADKIINNRTANSLVLLMATDIHLGAPNHSSVYETVKNAVTHAGQGMNEIRRNITPDGIVFLGDYNYASNDATKEENINIVKEVHQAFDEATRGITTVWLDGNHDYFVDEGKQGRVSDNERYALIGANNSKDAVVNYSHINGNYGYVDFERQKIRLIYLNTDDNEPTYGGSGVIGKTQGQWLIQTLLDMSQKGADEEKWGVVICTHWTPFDRAQLHYVLGDFKDRVAGRRHSLSYDFTNAKSELIGCFHGHIHNLKVTDIKTAGGNVIKAICVPNVYPLRQNPYWDSTTYGQTWGEFDKDSGEPVFYDKIADTAEDTSFNAVVIDRENKKIHAICYGAGYDRAIDYSGEGNEEPEIPVEPGTPASYAITNNLTNCTTSNSATSVQEGSSYNATLTANAGYTLGMVTVTMGGSAVSVTGGAINIASVTGDIVITATANEASGGGTTIENLLPKAVQLASNEIYGGDYDEDGVADGYAKGTRLSSSGSDRTDNEAIFATGFIEVNPTDTIYLKNVKISTNAENTYNEIAFYNSSKGFVSAIGKVTAYNILTNYGGTSETYENFPVLTSFSLQSLAAGLGVDFTANDVKYMRLSCLKISADSIITVNQPIE